MGIDASRTLQRDAPLTSPSGFPSPICPTFDQLGFTAAEQFDCQVARGVPLVPATIAGDDVVLAIETGMMSTLALSLRYAEDRGLYVENRSVSATGLAGTPPAHRAYATVPHVRALGREDWPGSVFAVDSRRWNGTAPDGRRIVGGIGIEFFLGCHVGIDVPRKRVAFTSRRLNSAPRPPEGVPLMRVGDVVHAATAALRLGLFPENSRPVLRIDSGAEHSVLTQDYFVTNVGVTRLLQRMVMWVFSRALRRRRPFELALKFPNGRELWVLLRFARSLRAFAHQLDMERVDGWLGSALFRQSLVVLNLLDGELCIWPS